MSRVLLSTSEGNEGHKAGSLTASISTRWNQSSMSKVRALRMGEEVFTGWAVGSQNASWSRKLKRQLARSAAAEPCETIVFGHTSMLYVSLERRCPLRAKRS